MSCEIRPLRYGDILGAQNSAELLAEYSEECSIPEIGEPNPQNALYARMEAAGFMHCFGAFEDGSLIGFAAVLFYVLPHYGKKVASVESLFLAKNRRSNGAGSELMSTLEHEAKTNGCEAILYSAPTGGQLERLLSAKKSCRRTNAVFTRKLQ